MCECCHSPLSRTRKHVFQTHWWLNVIHIVLFIEGDSSLYQLQACKHNFVAILFLSRMTSFAISVIQVIAGVLAEPCVCVCVRVPVCVCLLWIDNIRLLGVNLQWCTAHSSAELRLNLNYRYRDWPLFPPPKSQRFIFRCVIAVFLCREVTVAVSPRPVRHVTFCLFILLWFDPQGCVHITVIWAIRTEWEGVVLLRPDELSYSCHTLSARHFHKLLKWK